MHLVVVYVFPTCVGEHYLASAVVTKQLQRLQDRKISTSQDANLNICETCLCPLRLVVHVPLEIKLAHMDQATKSELHPSCWILAEEKELAPKASV